MKGKEGENFTFLRCCAITLLLVLHANSEQAELKSCQRIPAFGECGAADWELCSCSK